MQYTQKKSSSLLINEIFETLQGESRFTGTPAIFIRLMGCPVGCAFCDTKHTWELIDSNKIPMMEMKDKVNDNDKFSEVGINNLVDYCNDIFSAKHIVLTGGEPCLYDLTDITTAFIDNGYTVQIETSGTYEIKAHDDAFVTVSPKIEQSGGYKVLPSAINRANEIKHVVGKQRDIDNLQKIVLPHINKSATIWLQPMSTSKKATKLCIDTAIQNNWKVSIQTHKYIGVR